MIKVLLIGGSGFIGKHIIEHFFDSNKYLIIAPSSKELDAIDEEKVTEYLEKERFDIVLNFAIYGDGIDKKKDGTKMLEYNLRIFLNFEKNSHLYGKMYYAGSGAEYDKRYDIVDVTEDDEGKKIPIDQYGLMRYTIDRLIRRSDNIYGLKIFGIYGIYEQWQKRFISNCCCKAIKGLPLSIRKNKFFDYLYVKDFCCILERLMDIEPIEHAINVVRGEKIDLFSLAKIVLEVSGKELPIYVCEDGMGNEYTASNNRLIAEIGDFKYTDIKIAIKDMYKWYADNEWIISMSELLYQ